VLIRRLYAAQNVAVYPHALRIAGGFCSPFYPELKINQTRPNGNAGRHGYAGRPFLEKALPPMALTLFLLIRAGMGTVLPEPV
jgi:hypothetical protein